MGAVPAGEPCDLPDDEDGAIATYQMIRGSRSAVSQKPVSSQSQYRRRYVKLNTETPCSLRGRRAIELS